jgi:hypothetical protein
VFGKNYFYQTQTGPVRNRLRTGPAVTLSMSPTAMVLVVQLVRGGGDEDAVAGRVLVRVRVALMRRRGRMGRIVRGARRMGRRGAGLGTVLVRDHVARNVPDVRVSVAVAEIAGGLDAAARGAGADGSDGLLDIVEVVDRVVQDRIDVAAVADVHGAVDADIVDDVRIDRMARGRRMGLDAAETRTKCNRENGRKQTAR